MMNEDIIVYFRYLVISSNSSIYCFQMEGKHLQARVARSYGLPALLLFTKFYLSILVGLYTKKVSISIGENY